jgi:5,10-methylenetetrahydrofolate reductase
MIQYLTYFVVDLQRGNRISTSHCHYLGINNVMALRGDAVRRAITVPMGGNSRNRFSAAD